MKQLFFPLFFIFGLTSLQGQEIRMAIESFPAGWNNVTTEFFYGGSGISLDYQHTFDFGKLGAGIELRSINWGNQISLNIPYIHHFMIKDRWNLSANITPQLGLALFREKPLFVWSLQYMPEFTWTPLKKYHFFMGIGIRYSHSPSYINYGKINQVLEYPINIGIKKVLGSKNSTKEN